MINGALATTKAFLMILIINVHGLVDLLPGESMTCTESTGLVTCENAEGNFLTKIRGENIVAIVIVKSDMGYVSEEDFSKFTNVREIKIDECEIPHRVIGYMLSPKELKILKITNSTITDYYFPPLNHSSSLKVLSIQSNSFGIFIPTGFFFDFPHLEEIDLSHNKLFEIEKGVFQRLSALRKIDLSHNNSLSLLSDMNLSIGTFHNLSRLEEIDLSYNMVRVLEGDPFLGLSSLKKLNLSYNRIDGGYNRKSIQPEVFDNLPRLEALDLSHNLVLAIESDAFRGLSALRRLDLTENWFDDFDMSSLSLPAGCVAQSLVATCHHNRITNVYEKVHSSF